MNLISLKRLVRACCLLTAFLFISALFLLPGRVAAQSDSAEGDDPGAGLERVEVDWLEQARSGGFTMVVLGAVALFGLAFAIERALIIRRDRFCPRALADEAQALVARRDFAGLKALSEQHPSTLGRIIVFLVDHRDNDYEKLSDMAENLGARDILDQEERTFPLAVVAAVAPLLGLLGTMIGMIEAFQLVSIYGDEGGASMLAGSIAKALITTAAGLTLAIPAIAAFHFFKHKVHTIGVQLDKDLELLLTGLFLEKTGDAPASGDDGDA